MTLVPVIGRDNGLARGRSWCACCSRKKRGKRRQGASASASVMQRGEGRWGGGERMRQGRLGHQRKQSDDQVGRRGGEAGEHGVLGMHFAYRAYLEGRVLLCPCGALRSVNGPHLPPAPLRPRPINPSMPGPFRASFLLVQLVALWAVHHNAAVPAPLLPLPKPFLGGRRVRPLHHCH